MTWSEIRFDPPDRTLRQFAGLWLGFFVLLAGWSYFGHSQPIPAVILAALGLAIGVSGLFRPRAIRWVFVASLVAAFPIGWVLSHVLLALAFYGVFLPIGLLFRLMGRDPLQLRPNSDQATYWAPKPMPADLRRYLRQF